MGALFLFFTLAYRNRHELNEVKTILNNGDYTWFVVGIGCQVFFLFLQVVMYRQLLSLWAVLPWREVWRFTLASNSINKLVPSGGVSGLLVFTGQAKECGVKSAASLATNIWFYILDYGSFLLVVWWGLAYYLLHSGNGSVRWAVYAFTLIFLAVALIVLTVMGRAGASANWLSRRLSRLPQAFRGILARVINLLDQIGEAQYGRKKALKPFFQAFVAGFLMQITDVAILYLCFLTVSFHMPVAKVVAGFGLASVMSMISMVPQGIGIYETAMTWVYVQMGVPLSAAFAVSILYRGITFWLTIIPGLFTLHQGGDKV